jgi:parallel beta-helix repeat protein
VLVLFIITLLFVGYSIIQMEEQGTTDDNLIDIEGTYLQHDSIFITTNSDFEEQDWPGNGSLMNPYIIEGLNISSHYSCITIRHTTICFEIRDCLLMAPYSSSDDAAVEFVNVSYASVKNCLLINHVSGVLVRNSINCSLVNNTALSSSYYGMDTGFQISYSTNSTLRQNNVTNARYGYYMGDSSNCALISNTASDIKHEAAALWWSNCCIVHNNNFGETGLKIWGYKESNWLHEITNNTFKEKPIGYFKELADTAIDGALYGQIILAKCENVTIKDVESPHVVIGVNLGFCTDCTVEDCYSYDNEDRGFGMLYCTNCTFVRCISIGNFNEFELGYCRNCTLANNIALLNWGGYYCYSAYNCTLSNNIASGNEIGFLLDHLYNCTVSNNTATNNNDKGISFYYSNNCTVTNNTITNNEGGGLFFDWGCNNNEIYYNRFANNGEYNAHDRGYFNRWDDGISCGNYWDDWNGTGTYAVPTIGAHGIIDNFPQLWIQPEHAYDITTVLVLSCIGLVTIVVVVEDFIRKKHGEGSQVATP